MQVFDRFTPGDQRFILGNTIHLLRFLDIAKLDTFTNYFDCVPSLFERIAGEFTVFVDVNNDFAPLFAAIKEMSLDSKELSLFAAVLVYSASQLNTF